MHSVCFEHFSNIQITKMLMIIGNRLTAGRLLAQLVALAQLDSLEKLILLAY